MLFMHNINKLINELSGYLLIHAKMALNKSLLSFFLMHGSLPASLTLKDSSENDLYKKNNNIFPEHVPLKTRVIAVYV